MTSPICTIGPVAAKKSPTNRPAKPSWSDDYGDDPVRRMRGSESGRRHRSVRRPPVAGLGVRRAAPRESLQTLDGRRRQLDPEDLRDLMHDYQHVIGELSLVTGDKGVFDVVVDGDDPFAKRLPTVVVANHADEIVVPALTHPAAAAVLDIDTIDQQHHRLVDLINTLYGAMRKRAGKTVLGSILGELTTYTVQHFEEEERLMADAGYTDLDQHKRLHEKLVGQVLDFKSQFESGSATVSMDLMTFLSDWLVNHIKGEDCRYVPELKGKL